MEWRQVYSENVGAVGWDDDNLLVKWIKSGKLSLYEGVDYDTFDKCARAPSVQQYINSEIKGSYTHRYLDTE